MRETYNPFFSKPLDPGFLDAPNPAPCAGCLAASELSKLSKLQQAFGYLIPEALLAREKKAAPAGRDRIFTQSADYLLGLSGPGSLQGLFVPARPAEDSGMVEVRAALPEKTLRRHQRLLPGTPAPGLLYPGLSTPTLPGAWSERSEHRLHKGRSVKVADGTCLSMPIPQPTRSAGPRARPKKPGCGFPILKLTAIFSLASGALLHLWHASKHVHESVLLRSLWDCLCPVHPSGRPRLRLLPDRKPPAARGGCRHAPSSGAAHRHAPRKTPKSRGAAYHLDQAGQRKRRRSKRTTPSQRLWLCVDQLSGLHSGLLQHLATMTLLDHDLHPASTRCLLFDFQRVPSIELHFREIKTLWAWMCCDAERPQVVSRRCSCINRLQHGALHGGGCPAIPFGSLPSSSFKATLHSIAHFSNAIHPADGKPRQTESSSGHSHPKHR